MSDASSHAAINLTKDNFEEEVLKFSGVVLIDFWAEWCGPCKVMSPRIDELAKKYEGDTRVKIAQIDVDAETELQVEHQILSIPTFKVYAAGEVVDQKSGVMSPPVLEHLLVNGLEKLPAAN